MAGSVDNNDVVTCLGSSWHISGHNKDTCNQNLFRQFTATAAAAAMNELGSKHKCYCQAIDLRSLFVFQFTCSFPLCSMCQFKLLSQCSIIYDLSRSLTLTQLHLLMIMENQGLGHRQQQTSDKCGENRMNSGLLQLLHMSRNTVHFINFSTLVTCGEKSFSTLIIEII